MTKAAKPKLDDQAKAFRKAARELGCDDNEERFREALRTVAQPKSTASKEAKKRKTK
jgi:hypothetical protein